MYAVALRSRVPRAVLFENLLLIIEVDVRLLDWDEVDGMLELD